MLSCAESGDTARLLLLLDGRAPAGGHSHSGGMEAAVNAGFVQTSSDVEQFCRGRLQTAGRVAAGFARAACAGSDAPTLDDEFDARTPSEAMRTASIQLANGLRRLTRALVLPTRGRHHSVVLGTAIAAAGGTPELAARAAALQSITAPASAAVRLLGLDPYTVQGILARMAPEVDACVPLDLPADAAPMLDLLADIHLTREVRLFAS